MSKTKEESRNSILAKPLEITPAMFDGKGVIELVDNLDKDLRSIVLDGTTAKGRQECVSLAANVRSSKVHIDKVGAELVKPLKDKAKIIDVQRKQVRDKLDALAVYLRQPATDWETSEAKRKDSHRKALQDILKLKDNVEFMGINQIMDRITSLEGYKTYNFEEYSNDAKSYITGIEVALNGALANAKKREEDAKELERLRREKAEREAAEAKKAAATPTPLAPEVPVKPYAESVEPEKPLPPEDVPVMPHAQAQDARGPAPTTPKPVNNSREHMRQVHNEVVDTLMRLTPLDQASAQAVVVAIVTKKIPHVSISYETD